MAPWGRLSGVIFSGLKNSKMFFYSSLLGGGHLRPLREKGGTRRQGARGGPEEAGIEKVDRRLQPNAKVPFIFQFYEAFLRVGITNYQFLQRIMMAGSVDGSADLSRALYQHRQDPSEASSVWGTNATPETWIEHQHSHP